MTIYTNIRIFDGQKLHENKGLKVQKGKVVALLSSEDYGGEDVVSLKGGILSPGYVETQANGGGGVLFNQEPTIEGLKTILKAHRRYGTVAMLPTFITDTAQNMAKAVKAIEEGLAQNLKGLIGGHFEGPFLNAEKKGTHRADYIRKPNQEDLALFQSADLGKSLITLAPENVELSFIKALKKAGLKIAAGHSMATKADMVNAHKHGLEGITHLYNAMPALQGREPSIIGSAPALGLYSGIIVDNIHSDEFSMKLAYKALGAKRLMLVTDSMHTIGIEGITEFELMGQKVFVKDGQLINEFGSLAGAHITMEQSVKNAVKFMGANVEDALQMAISTPAEFMDCPHLATIINRDISDILWLDDQLNIQSFLEQF